MKFLIWLNNTFPPKEFMLRSTGGIKYFKLGTAMQIILISLLVTTGCFVGLFTYKMQFLQTVNLDDLPGHAIPQLEKLRYKV